MKPLVTLLLSAGLGACTVGVAADRVPAGRGIACTDANQCGAGMTCEGGYCRGKTAISNVLLAVAMPESVNLAQYSNMSFVLPLVIPPSGHGDIALPALESITIDTSFAELGANNVGCDYTRGGSPLAITAEISHRWPVEGLENSLVRYADQLPATFSGLPVDSDYELHLAPSASFQTNLSAQGAVCPLPPVLFRNLGVGSAANVTLDWPAPRSAAIDIRVPSAVPTGDLAGWQLDIVDPVGERQLAIPITLGSAVVDTGDTKLSHYRATLVYTPIASAGSSPPIGTELLRLRPKQGRAAPTYYVTLSSLSLFGSTGESILDLSGVPEQVLLSGRVESASDRTSIAQANVTFTGTGFGVGNVGLSAKFNVAADTDASGAFVVTLPAGQYRVVAVPPKDEEHASVEASWTIQATPATQAGRLLSLPSLLRLAGGVDGTVRWSPSNSASIQVTPSSRIVYDQTTGAASLRESSPGARTAQLLFQPTQDASFELFTDAGSFDVSLRPPKGLPWIVTPGLQITPEQSTMQPWTMPLPAYWDGHLRVPLAGGDDDSNLNDLPRAVMRVFVLVDANRRVVQTTAEATSIVQIAEDRAAADGSFSLVLPDQVQWQ